MHLLSPFIIRALIHFHFTLLGVHRYYLTEHLLCAKHQAFSKAAEGGAWIHSKHGGRKTHRAGVRNIPESVQRGCVCGSRQGSCLFFSLLLAEHAAASCSKSRTHSAVLAPLPQADPHFRGLSLFESSLAESSLSILQGEWLLFPHLSSL